MTRPRHPRYKFSLLGTDWVEWMLVALLCAVSMVGVAALGGSLIVTVAVGLVVVVATSLVVAVL
ncbi:MAG TPA: hypothetical protein VIW24_14110 [Aldersonia sp.]